ncbi:MAG: hypothetical protein EOO51_09285 [Flavobacterium sp.]|nr:MAG: hypothetical protein EOO51_09285 [Flavobacterium sp.]
MEEKSFTAKMYEQAEDYARTTIELYKLKATKTFAEIFASVSTGIILAVIFSLILLFGSIGLALYLGEVMGKWHYGFFAVMGLYAIVAVVIYIYRVKCFTERLTEYIIKKIFKD